MKRLVIAGIFLAITGFFYSCQKEEQMKVPADNAVTKSAKDDIVNYDDVISDLLAYGAIEIPVEESGLDLKSIPFDHYLSCQYFQTKTGAFLVLKYDPNDKPYTVAQSQCNKNYSKTVDSETGKVTSISCDGSGNSCCYFISTDYDGTQSVRIVVTGGVK